MPQETAVSQWSTEQVVAWLDGYVEPELIRKHKIDGPALLDLTRQDLEEDLLVFDVETQDIVSGNIENLKSWERKNAYLDEELVARPPAAKDSKWTSLGRLYSPGIVFVGNNDHDGQPDLYGQEDCSGGYMFAVRGDGREIFRSPSLSLRPDVGRSHPIVVDPEMRWLYVSENGSNSIRKWDYDGKPLQTLNGVHGPMAVDPTTHHVWVLVQTGCIATDHTRIYATRDGRWKLLRELPFAGLDIGYDAVSQAMWIIGSTLRKVNAADGKEVFNNPFSKWHPLQMQIDDTEPDPEGGVGCIWAVEGASGDCGTRRLCCFAFDGTVNFDWRPETPPTRVTKDADRAGAWVVLSSPGADELVFVDRSGTLHEHFKAATYFKGKTIDNIHLDVDGKLWVVGHSEQKGVDVTLFCLDIDQEKVTYTTELPDRTTINWMADLAATESFEQAFGEFQTEQLSMRATPGRATPHRNTIAATPGATPRPKSCDARAMKGSAAMMRIADNSAEESTDWSLSRLKHNLAGVPLCDDQLREIFDSYDADGNGFLSKREVKKIYQSFNTFGLDDSKQIETLIGSFNMLGDGTVSYEEFAILMLKISQQ